MQTIAELRAKGKTVFLITHRPGAIAAADQLVILKDGQISMAGPRDVVLAALNKAQTPAAAAPQLT